MPTQVVWADIPVNDLTRAIEFYQRVTNTPIKRIAPNAAVFEHLTGTASISLFQVDAPINNQQAAVIYLSINQDISNAIAMVENAGGKIVRELHKIEPYGYRAIIIDSEGNRLALHQDID